MKNQQQEPAKPTAPVTRTPDNFQLARSLFNARRRLLEKADALFEGAAPEVQALCEAAEEAAASKRIDVEPSSPVASRDAAATMS